MKHDIDGKIGYTNDHLLNFLLSEIEPNSTLLDIGCGPKLYSTPFMSICKSVLTIDAWESVNPDIVADVEKISLFNIVNSKKFDYILLIDFIEHLEKEAGLRLINECKQLVNKKIFLLTPLESIWTDNKHHVEDENLWCYGNHYDLHKSVWSHNDFSDWSEIKLKALKNFYFGYYSNE